MRSFEVGEAECAAAGVDDALHKLPRRIHNVNVAVENLAGILCMREHGAELKSMFAMPVNRRGSPGFQPLDSRSFMALLTEVGTCVANRRENHWVSGVCT